MTREDRVAAWVRAIGQLALVLLTGCVSVPFVAAETCTGGGLTLHQQQARGCAYYDALTLDAVRTLDESGLATAVELGQLARDTAAWARADTRAFECPPFGWGWGCYQPEGRALVLAAGGTSLVHELLHALQDLRGEPLSHAGWEVRGAREGAALVPILGGRSAYVGSWWETADRFAARWALRLFPPENIGQLVAKVCPLRPASYFATSPRRVPTGCSPAGTPALTPESTCRASSSPCSR